METSYRELKCKYVVNVTDGKNLGKTCDIVFTFPEGRVIGIAVPGKSGIRLFRREDLCASAILNKRAALFEILNGDKFSLRKLLTFPFFSFTI